MNWLVSNLDPFGTNLDVFTPSINCSVSLTFLIYRYSLTNPLHTFNLGMCLRFLKFHEEQNHVFCKRNKNLSYAQCKRWVNMAHRFD